MRNMLTTKQELEIIEKKKSGYSIKQIMSEYKIKNAKTIYDVIKRNGREKLIANKKYDVDENFFENIDTEEKAYWLGFLYADGYVRIKNGVSGELRLKLGIKDKSHIELFNKSLKSNYRIKDDISKVIVDGIIHTSECSSLSIFNTKIVKDLINIGCIERKTFTIRLPTLRENLMRHFIRGYFDGDGCIHILSNKLNSATITISSNYDFVFDILGYLGFGNIYKHTSIFTYTVCKKDLVEKIFDLFYKDSTIYLSRKKDIFDSFINRNKLML